MDVSCSEEGEGDKMRRRGCEAILTFRFSAFLALKPCKRRIFPPLPNLNLGLASFGTSALDTDTTPGGPLQMSTALGLSRDIWFHTQ